MDEWYVFCDFILEIILMTVESVRKVEQNYFIGAYEEGLERTVQGVQIIIWFMMAIYVHYRGKFEL